MQTYSLLKTVLSEGECLISQPATMSMQAKENSRVLGIQVKPC